MSYIQFCFVCLNALVLELAKQNKKQLILIMLFVVIVANLKGMDRGRVASAMAVGLELKV